MTMIEEIARAMCETYSDCQCTDGYAGPVCQSAELLTLARAAVQRMRTPSEPVLAAGRHANRLTPTNALGLVYVPPDAAWTAMIDAILAEGEKGKTP